MEVTYHRCAGLDVHKKTVVACAIVPGADGKASETCRTFGTFSRELLLLSDWLASQGVTQVALESTGEFWKPVYNLLEANFTVLVVNAQHLKNVPGRKTDLKDAQWIAQLLRCGLLRGSFIPPLPQRDLRDLTRQRTNLIRERADVVNRLHKVLEWANLKLTSVVTDIGGVSARSMLEALLGGQSDPETLAQLAKGRLRAKRAMLVEALTGQLREHHRFLLANHLTHIDFLEEQIAQFDTQIVALLQAQPTVETLEAGDHAEASGWQAAVALLDTIPGVGRATAEVLLAEIGPDMSRFPSAAHLARWARVCPGNHESAGKRLSGSTGQGNNWLRSSLVQAANAAARCTGTYLSAVYHRLAGRRGRQRAIVAVAHRILTAAYHMLLQGRPYVDLGGQYLDERRKGQLLKRMQRRIEQLGYCVKLEEPPPSSAAQT